MDSKSRVTPIENTSILPVIAVRKIMGDPRRSLEGIGVRTDRTPSHKSTNSLRPSKAIFFE